MQFLADLCSSLSESSQRKKRRENCSSAASQSGCVHLGSIERARDATKHLPDTDSDYVMKKPWRCWLGAVPRYWKVVASCFYNVRFAENNCAPLAPRARIFQPILLLFFSCSRTSFEAKMRKGQSTYLLTSRDIVGRSLEVLLVTNFQNLAKCALKNYSQRYRELPFEINLSCFDLVVSGCLSSVTSTFFFSLLVCLTEKLPTSSQQDQSQSPNLEYKRPLPSAPFLSDEEGNCSIWLSRAL